MEDAPKLGPCSPFFIVTDIKAALAHYVIRLGFSVQYNSPADDPFFLIVGRDAAQIMLRAVPEGITPVPNHTRHGDARWDAFILTPDPDTLAAELAGRNAKFHRTIRDWEDGLRGFEIADPDGYVCFFGRPNFLCNSIS